MRLPLISQLVRYCSGSTLAEYRGSAAYGIVEEAYKTQSLFNPNYPKLDLHLLQPAFIPALGIGAWWTVCVEILLLPRVGSCCFE